MVAGNTPGRVKARRAARAQQADTSHADLLERQLSTLHERSDQLHRELQGPAPRVGHDTMLTVLEGFRLLGDSQAPRVAGA